MKRLLWFRNDLRVHDNETLTKALEGECELTCIYVFDPRLEHKTPEGYPRISEPRRTFLAQTLRDLESRLHDLGLDLTCLVGRPADLIPEICTRLQIEEVFYARCTSYLEREDEAALAPKLEGMGVRTRTSQTQTLLCDEDTGRFDLYRSMSFSKLRKFAETSWPIRVPLAEPTQRPRSSLALPPEFERWNFEPHLAGSRHERGIRLAGGETEALARVRAYFWDGDHLKSYKQTRNGLLALNDSSKFTPYLATGCLSPRYLYAEVRRYERERVKNVSTLWFLYELLWRDLFHFAARRHPALPEDPDPAPKAKAAFEMWRTARTGNRFVDAAMIELADTGWLSNRMRQNVASYFVHHMKGAWEVGARWFESCLVDYDPCSNTGNWAYVAGEWGNAPHVFDIDQQAGMYDPDEAYRDFWL